MGEDKEKTIAEMVEDIRYERRKKFFKKIQRVMGNVSRLHMEGESNGDEYQFAYYPDPQLMTKLSDEFKEVGLAMGLPQILNAENLDNLQTRNCLWQRVRVTVKLTVVDTETGFSQEGVVIGDGVDTMGKAIFSAITNAKKYFFGLLFMLPMSGDLDKDQAHREALEMAKTVNTEVMQDALRMKAGAAMRAVGGKKKLALLLPEDEKTIKKDPEKWSMDLCERVILSVKAEMADKISREKEKETAETGAEKLKEAASAGD
jgi:hypothetical protein